jgi:hypothetical protein
MLHKIARNLVLVPFAFIRFITFIGYRQFVFIALHAGHWDYDARSNDDQFVLFMEKLIFVICYLCLACPWLSLEMFMQTTITKNSAWLGRQDNSDRQTYEKMNKHLRLSSPKAYPLDLYRFPAATAYPWYCLGSNKLSHITQSHGESNTARLLRRWVYGQEGNSPVVESWLGCGSLNDIDDSSSDVSESGLRMRRHPRNDSCVPVVATLLSGNGDATSLETDTDGSIASSISGSPELGYPRIHR